MEGCITTVHALPSHCPRLLVVHFRAKPLSNIVPHSPGMGEADQTSSRHAGLDIPCLVRDAQDRRQGFSCKRDHAQLSPIPPFHAFFFIRSLWLNSVSFLEAARVASDV